MKLCTVVFDSNKADFSKLVKVWKHTASKYIPNADAVVLTVPAPENIERPCDRYMSYASSYAFLKKAEYAIAQNDNVIFTDADIMFTGDCKNVFKLPFDIAITTRPARTWINGGVVLYKPTGKDKLQEVIVLMNQIINNVALYREGLIKYLGADQLALAMLSRKRNFLRLPCAEYNLEQHTWDQYSERTKIVHMKSNLWDLVQGDTPRIEVDKNHITYTIYKRWLEELKEATVDERP
jgi:hypothetical protein